MSFYGEYVCIDFIKMGLVSFVLTFDLVTVTSFSVIKGHKNLYVCWYVHINILLGTRYECI